MKRFIFLLALSLSLLVAVSQHTSVYAKDTWVSVRTKNFFMLGNANEKDIRKVGLKLEQFREVFTQLFPKLKFNTPVPTTVVVFKNDSSFAPFKPRESIAGYFQPGSDVNYIALKTEVRGQRDSFDVIFHEYIHLLVGNTFENAPVWFNEGLAEYYSTFSITDDQKVVIGSPISNHVFLLRESNMLPLRTLFEVDHKSPHYNESTKSSIFYAQSWALMHYLIIGKTGKVEQLGKFMELVRTKVPMEQAFQQAFETPFEVMEKDLREYVKKDRYNVLKGHFEQKLELETNTQATPLTEAEAQAYLGDLLLHSYRKDALTYLEKALKLDPNLTMAHASMGMAYFREGRANEALASLERAVAGDSKNYLAHYYYAFILSRAHANEGPTNTGLPLEIVTKARDHVQKAIALRPDFPESYNLLAFLSLITGQGIDESIAQMKSLLANSPGKHDHIYMLGQLYLRKEDHKMARELMGIVAKSSAEEQMRSHAEQILKQIQQYEDARTRFEEAKQYAKKTGQREPVMDFGPNGTKTPATPPDPSSYLREVLRMPGAGETQLQATLVKIECEPKGGIVFVVQTANGLMRLRTEKFEDIELTTYDPKVAGEITCGERELKNVVIVCYLPNADKKVKADGVLKSIEFVPAEFKLK